MTGEGLTGGRGDKFESLGVDCLTFEGWGWGKGGEVEHSQKIFLRHLKAREKRNYATLISCI